MGMKFIVEDIAKKRNLEVRLEHDGEDVDIIVTGDDGVEYVIAYLNDKGLTLCSLSADDDETSGIELCSLGYIKNRRD
jgi:hypothetical protein